MAENVLRRARSQSAQLFLPTHHPAYGKIGKKPSRSRSNLQKICHAGKVHAVCEKNANASQTEKNFVRKRTICI